MMTMLSIIVVVRVCDRSVVLSVVGLNNLINSLRGVLWGSQILIDSGWRM